MHLNQIPEQIIRVSFSTMTETIIDYINRIGSETLADSPFNEVDSLILSQFSYLKFDCFVPGIGSELKPITLKDIYESEQYDSLYADERYRKNNTALFEAMMNSKRFGGIKLSNFINIIEVDKETQFAAVVIEFDEGMVYVAFRGTDENLVSWKEDLNMALLRPIPGQIRSVKYLNRVSDYLPEHFCVGGHSKGGNLAVYSSMFCDKQVQDRIEVIYNHDGPGMREELINDESYAAIHDRIRMTVPRSSLVGMLLLNHDTYSVVESKNIGIMQHDPFGWKVDGYSFKYADGINEGRAIIDKSINEWVMSLDENQIKLFVDTVYDIMCASEATTLNDVIANWQNIVPRVANALKEVDPKTKEIIQEIIALLMELAGINTKAEIALHIDELKAFTSEITSEIKDKAEEKSKEFLDKKNNSKKIKKMFDK